MRSATVTTTGLRPPVRPDGTARGRPRHSGFLSPRRWVRDRQGSAVSPQGEEGGMLARFLLGGAG